MLISGYGLTASIPDVQSSMNVIFAPWPSVNFPSLKNCSSTDVNCIISVANAAAAYPGIALFYGFSLIYSALTRMNAFGSIMQTFLFGGAFQNGGTPLLGIVMGALILTAVIEIMRIARGSSSGV